MEKQKYKASAEKYRTEVRKYSDTNERQILHSGDVNLFYKFVNGKLKNCDSIPVLKVDDGSYVVSDREKAEIFSEHFPLCIA